MLKRALLALTLISMTSCDLATSEVSACPTLYSYPPELQKRAADESTRLPPGSALRIFMRDYAAVRAEIRACKGVR